MSTPVTQVEREIVLPYHVGVKERTALTYLCRRKPEIREQVKARCAEDSVFFINTFGYTFDPRVDAAQHDAPFLLYDFQEEQVHWMDVRVERMEDGVIEKSRDMGVTWVSLAWLVHQWLFKPGFQALIGSRKEDLVDNWTLDSHFGKIQYFIEHLPAWLLPKGFSLAHHRLKLKLVNPENGNVIIGESANSEFSRQGRYTVILFDEAAFWSDLASAFRAAAQATRSRFLVSTPNGLNAFFRERDSGRYHILTIHWSQHPLKDDAWYKRETARMSVEDVAQEIDINYHRSARGVVYPTFATLLRGEFPYERGMSLFCCWDFGVSDDTAIIWVARNSTTGMLRLIDCYKNNNKPIDFYVPFIIGYIPEDNDFDYTSDELLMIHQHARLPQPMHYGDPDVNKRGMATATSAFDELSKRGITVFTNQFAKDFPERKRKTELGIKRIEGINWPNCAEAWEALCNARFPQKNPDSQSTAGINKPIHDWTEAYRSALEYFFVNEPPFFEFERPKPERRVMAYDSIT